MDSDSSDTFWQWFEQIVLPTLSCEDVPPKAVIRELDERMDRLGLSWELGPAPDGSDDWGFAVSFGADSDRLDLADRLVSAAPSMFRCQVLLGKPRKSWNGVLELPIGDEWIRYSTADWKCLILPMGDGVAIMVSPTGTDVAEEVVTAMAASIAVQSELGEVRFTRHVRDLSVVGPDRIDALPGIRCRMDELGSIVALE